MFDFPTKKTFKQDFLGENGNILFTLCYEQATLQEFFDFYKKDAVSQTLELYEIIEKQIPLTFFDRIKKKIFWNYKTRTGKGIDYENIAENIQRNRFRMYDSIFTEYDAKQRKKGGKSAFFGNTLKNICKEYASPIDVVLNLTLEQFFYLADGLRYWQNETTKEGQAVNNYATRDTDWAKKSAEKIKQAFNQK